MNLARLTHLCDENRGNNESAVMKTKFAVMAMMVPLLGACSGQLGMSGNEDGKSGEAEVPEAVLQLAAPNQNVQSARMQEDGCFWYEYAGPVETTRLPLTTVDGKRICGQAGAGETTPGYSS